jgi:catechol 2,3-dioxygenase
VIHQRVPVVVSALPKANIARMDAINTATAPTFATSTPLHIGAVALNVRDLDRVAAYYRDLLGLADLAGDGDTIHLGAGGVTLISLTRRADARPDDAREAGLYHTAFLMPTRADLAHFVVHLAQARIPVTGASDHGVSEAIYLDDPEGNGVEVYADRPPERWQWRDGLVAMPTKALDFEDLVGTGESPVNAGAAPDGLRVGHIHLRVGDLDAAARFYQDGIGLAPTRRRGGALFMSSARYHHHVATNVWHSEGAGRRAEDRAGLAWFTIAADDAALTDVERRLHAIGAPLVSLAVGFETADPWGTRIRIVPASPS